MDFAPLDWIFLSDVLVVAAAADRERAPEITRSVGARRTGLRGLRFHVPVPESLHFIHVGAETGRVAVLFGRPRDYRSVQLKLEGVRPVSTTADDREAIARYRAELGLALEPVGVPPGIWDLLMSREVVTLEGLVDSAWQQTPGPNSGTRIGGTSP